MIKTRTWIVILAVVLVLACGACLLIFFLPSGGRIANVYQDGVCIYSFDLDRVSEDFEVTVTDERGSNTIRVEQGRICVEEADCPDQVCVKSGWLTDSAAPIVCLPHRLVIQMEDSAAAESDIDSVAS